MISRLIASAETALQIALIPALGSIIMALILRYFSKPEKFAAMVHMIYGAGDLALETAGGAQRMLFKNGGKASKL